MMLHFQLSKSSDIAVYAIIISAEMTFEALLMVIGATLWFKRTDNSDIMKIVFLTAQHGKS